MGKTAAVAGVHTAAAATRMHGTLDRSARAARAVVAPHLPRTGPSSNAGPFTLGWKSVRDLGYL